MLSTVLVNSSIESLTSSPIFEKPIFTFEPNVTFPFVSHDIYPSANLPEPSLLS